jgi:flagellar protein FliO/FliZ
MNFSKLALPFLLAAGVSAQAVAQAVAPSAATAPPSSAGSFFQVLLGLIFVLALMAAAAWSLKKFGVAKLAGNAAVKIIGGVSVGSRERVMLIEVGDQWIVIGVAPGQVTALSTMPKQEIVPAMDVTPLAKNFSSWLKQTIDKRNGK